MPLDDDAPDLGAAGLPLPVAELLRRARNAKSPRERHDAAFHAWEAAVRLGVAARGAGRRLAGRGAPSLGDWVSALAPDDRDLPSAALAALADLFREVVEERREGGTPATPTARGLLGLFVAYRNRVVGHGAARPSAFYERAGGLLAAGLREAEARGLFRPAGARLTHVESIEIDPVGRRRARLLDLTGEVATLIDPAGTPDVPPELRPGRVYLRSSSGSGAGRWVDLHPLVLFAESDLRERVYFLNGRRRSAEFIDFASGDVLRGKALAAACATIEADLDAAGSGGGAQEPPAVGPTSGPPEPAPERAPGPDQLGDFRLLGRLGAGAMGIVHLARQQSLDRLVALKVLTPELSPDPTARRRFRREIAALSRCDHPNVVKILASGEDEARGVPYYAMELVEGADLGAVASALPSSGGDLDRAITSASEETRRAKAAALSSSGAASDAGAPALEEAPSAPGASRTADAAAAAPAAPPVERFRRLARLFRDAARGVQHIHDAGIIHRDLKPANLMITADDRRIVVMDLGLAALPSTARTATLTRDGAGLLGTLRYMPPEQLRRGLLELDGRADVYALGATLYELACRRPLFDGDSEARLVEQVLHDEPLAAEKAEPRLPRDLGVILRKALAKDRRARYATAAALAADLDAFAEGRPISARPPTLRYLLGLAVARNPVAASLAALVLLVVVGAVAVYVVQVGRARELEVAARARAERSRAEAETARAEAEAARFEAEGILEFMLGDLKERLEPLGRVDLLERVAAKAQAYYRGRTDEPKDAAGLARRARAERLLGEVDASLGRLDEALKSGRASLAWAVSATARDAGNRDARRALRNAHGALGGVLFHRGRPDEARVHFEAALAAAKDLLAEAPEEIDAVAGAGWAHDKLGATLDVLGDTAGALETVRRGLAIWEGAVARHPRMLGFLHAAGDARRELAQLLLLRGDLAGADAAIRSAVAAGERLVGEERRNPEWEHGFADSLSAFGSILVLQGATDQALQVHRRELALREALSARDPANSTWRSAVALAHQGVGAVLFEAGRLAEALASFERGLAIRERLSSKDPSNLFWRHGVASAHVWVGRTHLARGDLDAAERSFRADLAIAERLVQDDPASTAWRHGLSTSHVWVGDAQVARGDHAAALESFREAVRIRAGLHAQDPGSAVWAGSLATAHGRVGEALMRMGAFEDALASLREGLAVQERRAAPDPTNKAAQDALAERHHAIGRCLALAGRYEEALESYRRDLAITDALSAGPAPMRRHVQAYAVVQSGIGNALGELGRLDEAIASFRAGLARAEAATASSTAQADDVEFLDALAGLHGGLGRALDARGDTTGALEALGKDIAIMEGIVARRGAQGRWAVTLADSRALLGRVLLFAGRTEEAIACVRLECALRDDLVARRPGDDAARVALCEARQTVGWALETMAAPGAPQEFRAALAALGSRPDDADAPAQVRAGRVFSLSGLAVSLARQGDLAAAASATARALALDPEAPEAHEAAAVTALAQGEAARAEAAATRAIDLSVDRRPPLYALLARGRARARLGRGADAFADLERFLDQGPFDARRDEVRREVESLRAAPAR